MANQGVLACRQCGRLYFYTYDVLDSKAEDPTTAVQEKKETLASQPWSKEYGSLPREAGRLSKTPYAGEPPPDHPWLTGMAFAVDHCD